LKFVALPIPEIIGDTQKIWAVLGYAHARSLYSHFFMGFCSDGPCECIGQICSPIALAVPEIIAIAVSGFANSNLGEVEAVGGRDGTVRKSVGEFL